MDSQEGSWKFTMADKVLGWFFSEEEKQKWMYAEKSTMPPLDNLTGGVPKQESQFQNAGSFKQPEANVFQGQHCEELSRDQYVYEKHSEKLNKASRVYARQKQKVTDYTTRLNLLHEEIAKKTIQVKFLTAQSAYLEQTQIDVKTGKKLSKEKLEKGLAYYSAKIRAEKIVLLSKLNQKDKLEKTLLDEQNLLTCVENKVSVVEKLISQGDIIDCLEDLTVVENDLKLPSLQNVEKLAAEQERVKEISEMTNEILDSGYGEKSMENKTLTVDDLTPEFMKFLEVEYVGELTQENYNEEHGNQNIPATPKRKKPPVMSSEKEFMEEELVSSESGTRRRDKLKESKNYKSQGERAYFSEAEVELFQQGSEQEFVIQSKGKKTSRKKRAQDNYASLV